MVKTVGSIRDVARETGLSTATISRVMNGSASVSRLTREKVLAACKKLDYAPNPAARALTTARSRMVAAIIPTIEHSVFAKFIAAIENTLGQQGYSLVMAISNGDETEELLAAQKLLGMGAEAFILSGSVHSEELLDIFERRNVPHVFTSIWEPDNARPTIGYDNAELASDAVRYLFDMGHRDIGIVHGPLHNSDRTRARRKGVARARLDGLQLNFVETDLSVAGGKFAAHDLIARTNRCTAVLCFSDVLALGAYFALAEAGLSIPQDMSVFGFDNLDWSSAIVPPLTTFDLPATGMGRDVAEQIVSHLEGKSAIEPRKLNCAIIERGSVAKLPT